MKKQYQFLMYTVVLTAAVSSVMISNAADNQDVALLNEQLDNAIYSYDPVENIIDLLKRGANIQSRNYADETPLHSAAYCCRPELVKALLELDANPRALNFDGRTPAEVAQRRGYFDIAESINKWIASNPKK